MKCGDILLVNYPFTDATGSKVRPVLVVSADTYNMGDDLILVPISSAPDSSDPHVFPLRETASFFKHTGLKRYSCIKWTKPITLSRRIIHSRLGFLPNNQLSEVQCKIKTLFER